MPNTLRLVSALAAILPAMPVFAQGVVSTEETLVKWQAACDKRQVLTANMLVREMDANGRLSSEQPWPAKFCFRPSPNAARLDVDRPVRESWIVTRDHRLLHTGAEPRTMDAGASERANLWVGDFPAFLLLGAEPDLVRHRYQVRAFESGDGELSVYLYPQRVQEQRKVARIEMRVDSKTYTPTHIHLVLVGGKHVFFMIEAIDAASSIDSKLFERL